MGSLIAWGAIQVLGNHGLLTESLFAKLVATSVSKAQQAEGAGTDQDLADRVGCSSTTVGNARNIKGKLQGHTLFNLLAVEPLAIEGLLHHFGRRSVPIEAKCDTDALLTTAGAVHKLAAVQCERSPGGKDITDAECLEIEGDVSAALESLSAIKVRCEAIRARRAA